LEIVHKSKNNGACELYKALSVGKYAQYPYEKCDLDDDMSVINQVIEGIGSLVSLWMIGIRLPLNLWIVGQPLNTIRTDDIDWQSLKGLPQDVIDKAKVECPFPYFC
jgi:hypothetical protein